MSIYYFAYGSCMDELDFKRTVEEFQVLGSAIIPNYRLAFTLYGASRQGGVADIVSSNGDQVQGVLFQFPDRFLAKLDEREGVPTKVYERIELLVYHRGNLLKACTYQVIDKSEKEIAPAEAYLQLMMNGMNKFASNEYQAKFKEKIKQDFGILMS
jgi:cation transport regulator ChaC